MIYFSIHCTLRFGLIFYGFFVIPFALRIWVIKLHAVATLIAAGRDRFFLFFVWSAATRIRFCASSTSAFRLRTEGSFTKVASRVRPASSSRMSSIMNLQTTLALLKYLLADTSFTCFGEMPKSAGIGLAFVPLWWRQILRAFPRLKWEDIAKSSGRRLPSSPPHV